MAGMMMTVLDAALVALAAEVGRRKTPNTSNRETVLMAESCTVGAACMTSSPDEKSLACLHSLDGDDVTERPAE